MNYQLEQILNRAFHKTPQLKALRGANLDQVLARLCSRFKVNGAALSLQQIGSLGLLPVFAARAKSQAVVLLSEPIAENLFPRSMHRVDAVAATGVAVNVDVSGSGADALMRLILMGVSAQHYLGASTINGECHVDALTAHYSGAPFRQILLGREYEPLHSEGEIRALLLPRVLRDHPSTRM